MRINIVETAKGMIYAVELLMKTGNVVRIEVDSNSVEGVFEDKRVTSAVLEYMNVREVTMRIRQGETTTVYVLTKCGVSKTMKWKSAESNAVFNHLFESIKSPTVSKAEFHSNSGSEKEKVLDYCNDCGARRARTPLGMIQCSACPRLYCGPCLVEHTLDHANWRLSNPCSPVREGFLCDHCILPDEEEIKIETRRSKASATSSQS